ncbi:P-loop containing nucleoside triphosphate hydrolase protein [Mycena leptocephala]|nr:P-loop containing nucleoside triphosphate hydrolase protein [Mycena leptocephala]
MNIRGLSPQHNLAQNEGLELDKLNGVVENLIQLTNPYRIRRTGASCDNAGEPISVALPPLTVVHVTFPLTSHEADEAHILEAQDNKAHTTGELENMRLRNLQNFYLKARMYTAFPPKREHDDLITRDNLQEGEYITKIIALAQLCHNILLNGADNVLPVEHHGSRDHIVEGVVVNIPDYSLTKPVAPVLPEGSDLVEKKIIIFTVFAQFHRHMKSFFDSCGMKTRVINGGLSAVARTKAINDFKTSDEHILIFSNVGSTGLDLTFARTILLPEANWSGVLDQQIIGRIHRQGQSQRTFVFQMMAKFTIDTLLAMIGLRKSEVAQKYMTPEQRIGYITAAIGDASTAEDDNEVESRLRETLKSLKKPRCKAKPTVIVDEEDGNVEMDPPADDRAGSPSLEKSAEGKGKGKASADVEHKNKRKKAKETDDEPAEADKGQGDAQPRRKRVKPDGSWSLGAPHSHAGKEGGGDKHSSCRRCAQVEGQGQEEREHGQGHGRRGTHPSRRRSEQALRPPFPQAPTEEDSDAETPRGPWAPGRVG